VLKCTIPKNILNKEQYLVSAYLSGENSVVLQSLTEILQFEMNEKRNEDYMGVINGLVRLGFHWDEL
jgi:hypothetical protein